MMTLLVVLGLLLVGFLILRLLMRGKLRQPFTIAVDGKPVQGEYRFGSKLPKVLGHSGTTINCTICFRGYTRAMNRTVMTAAGPLPPIHPLLAANELFHVTDRVRRGFLRYWARIVWQGLTIRRHDDRPYEIESSVAAPLIVAGTYPGVDAGMALDGFA